MCSGWFERDGGCCWVALRHGVHKAKKKLRQDFLETNTCPTIEREMKHNEQLCKGQWTRDVREESAYVCRSDSVVL